MSVVVNIEHVSKQFGSTRAVDDVSFDIRSGEIFGLLGPNGAGKTTTIRMVLDLFKPDQGTITLFGKPITDQAKGRIGYLPEERGLYKNVSVIDCLTYLTSLKGVERGEARRRATDYLERVALGHVANKKVKELSKGMQQKVQLGVALLHEPDLVVVDEPFYGLDPVNTRLVKDMLRASRDRGAAIVMSTHQMDRVEELCERMCMFHQGKVVLYGAVTEIQRRWAPNAVLVRGQGDFERIPGVERIDTSNGMVELWLDQTMHPQQVLRELANRPEIMIERFEVATPSLDDIFIAVVEGHDRVVHRSERPDVEVVEA
jgi:ABC-2 type transport system ATP-binding protein